MARNERITLSKEQWTALSVADVESITFQNIGRQPIYIAVTAGPAPSDKKATLVYEPGQGERNVALNELAPGVENPVRVYAFAPYLGHNEVFVSHA